MRSNRSRDTKLELRLRSELFAAGLRYRKHVSPVLGLRCQADLVFRSERLAVFIDGCFWHSCPDHHRRPSEAARHRDWWLAKLQATAIRDRRNDVRLYLEGWQVLRIWEHEDVREAAERVAVALRGARQNSSH
jgi:DNA mismatch endonuclease (patch repair protein)